MIKLILILMILYTLLGSALCTFFINNDFALSFTYGCLFMLINITGLVFFWKLIFLKKSIALAVIVIIFKYIILALVLWNLSLVNWIKHLGFVLGLASLVFSILMGLILKQFYKNVKV